MTMQRKSPKVVSDYETRLTSIRDLLEESIRSCPPYARAPLARQLVDVLGKLEALHPPEVRDRVDDLAAARAARRADAKSRAGAG